MIDNKQRFSTYLTCIMVFTTGIGYVNTLPQCRAAGESSALQETAPYRLQSDDFIEIGVVGESDMLRQVTVLPDGTISYLYTGDLFVRGMTLAELRKKLASILSKQFIRPQVTVSVLRRTPPTMSVVGSVKVPGLYPISENTHLLDVIAAAGGLTLAKPEQFHALFLQKGASEPVTIDLPRLFTMANSAANLAVKAGDILIVSDKTAAETQVQILGEVSRQGVYPVTDNLSLATAISSAGGVTENAALSRAVIRRGDKTIPVDLRPILSVNGAATETVINLQPGDTLFIPQNTLRVAVIGAVNRPGAIPFPEDGTLSTFESISLAGGQTVNADLKNVILLKASTLSGDKEPDVNSGIKLNLLENKKDKSTATKVASVKIEPGDILYVPFKGGRKGPTIGELAPLIGAAGWFIRR